MLLFKITLDCVFLTLRTQKSTGGLYIDCFLYNNKHETIYYLFMCSTNITLVLAIL